jgi:hypothetical protein
MHGDITRSTFDPALERTAVRQQQGRVLLDAEWNEQRDIELHDVRTARADIVGDAAAPVGDDGFEVTANGAGDGLDVSAGRFYVDGIRCVNHDGGPVPDLPTAAGRYLVYLDVWERPITAIEDPSIREVALGGPDTAIRTELMARVRLLPVGSGGPVPDCTTAFAEWDTLLAGATGTLEVRVDTSAAPADPCLVPESAGYRGLQNLLYRFEIQDGNLDLTAPGGVGAGTPTFKWAQHNASVVASWGAPSGLEIEVDRLGPGGADGFSMGRWLEISVDDHDLDDRPGRLAKVDTIVENKIELEAQAGLAAELSAMYDVDQHPRVRRWDSDGALDLEAGNWIDVDNGIQIRFAAGASWRPGDFWIVPARTAVLPGTGDRHIEWPVDALGDPVPVRAHGKHHQYARLAIADFDGSTWTVPSDCRSFFAPLADLVTFDLRGGDGQHAPSGHWLPRPLTVGVSRGLHAVADRTVRFVASGGGELSVTEPSEDGVVGSAAASVTIDTDAEGLAQVWWRLGPGPVPEEPGDRYQPAAAQTVVAELLDDGGQAQHQQLRIHATPVDLFTLVAAGGDGQIGYPGETLELALRARVTAGLRPAAGRRVAFEVLSRMLDGEALDEFRGGSLHATAGLVTADPWPGGSRTVRAVVETDADGVAQVQWILGTEVGLPVQRVTATLLDADGGPTAHQTLFSAHLAVADEILWEPCDRLAKLVDPELDRHTVQEALDLFCDLLVGGEARVLIAGGDRPPVHVTTVVSVPDLDGVEVGLTQSFPSVPAIALRSALEVHTLGDEGPAPPIVTLKGKVSASSTEGGTRVRWHLEDDSRAWLANEIATRAIDQMVLRVTLRPALLGRPGLLTDWSGGFRVRA